MLQRGITVCRDLAVRSAEAHTSFPFFATFCRSGAGATGLDFLLDDTAELESELARLKQEHRDLDMAIEALESMVAGDQLQIQRLKKRKLSLKDRIIQIEDQLTPDIIA